MSCHCTFSLKVTSLTGPWCEQDWVVPLIRISNVLGEEKSHCVQHTLELSGLCSCLPIYFSCFLFLFLRFLGIIPALNRLPFDVFPNKASFVSTVKYLHLTLLFGQIWRGCLKFFFILFIILKQQLRHQPELSRALLETNPSYSAFPIIELLKLDVILVSMQVQPLKSNFIIL